MQIGVLGCTVRVLCTCKPLNVALRVTYACRTGGADEFKVPNLYRPYRIHCSNVIEYLYPSPGGPQRCVLHVQKMTAPCGGDVRTPHVDLCKYLNNGVAELHRFKHTFLYIFFHTCCTTFRPRSLRVRSPGQKGHRTSNRISIKGGQFTYRSIWQSFPSPLVAFPTQ